MDDSGDFSVSGSESFVGKCRYLDTIKETKFGSTILVENKQNKRLYVIKKHRKGENGRKEAKLLSSLKHKNILNILGSGGDLKSTVIICDYAQGGSLADRMVRPYNWAKAIDVILGVAAGLDHAHRNNIVHGNLRPSNVLFDSDEVVKITDFGLPIHYDGPAKKNWYSPPEHKTSRQGDIYAMGVILFQMLTNRNPEYDAGGNLWLEDIAQGLPDDIQQMLRKLLAIRVSRRYRSAQEFMLDWDDFDRRRQEEEARRSRRPVQVADSKKQGPPTWVYLAAGLGILGAIAVILVLSGVFG
jgi:serine/threonine-protein kinase